MGVNEAKTAILENRTALGIEFGSTRIKAVLVDDKNQPIASGAYEWENQYVDGIWMLTSMDRDGTKDGFDIPLTRAVARAVPIPVIASGGVGTLEHFAEGIIEGEADAVLAASVFHFGTYSIRQVKEYMASQGFAVRLDF